MRNSWIATVLALTVPAPSLAKPIVVEVYRSELRVDEVKYLDSAGLEQTKYQIDGMDITLTKEDRVRARNWNLTPFDWVKYKYALEYTPRGLWTPNLDPPIVLGNLATTELERMKYAKIANEIEIDRRNREAAFQGAGVEHLKTINPMLGQPKPKTGLARFLPDGKTVLKSVFIDPLDCDGQCRDFLMNSVYSNSGRMQLNIYYSNGSKADLMALLAGVGIKDDYLLSKGVILTKDNTKYQAYIGDGQLPFYVYQTDDTVEVTFADP